MKHPYTPDIAFLTLGDGFADPVESPDYPEKIIRWRNNKAAETIGLEGLGADDWIKHFADFTPLEDNLKRPLAQRYHGHQFRQYNPNIGDGRGFLFAQMRDDKGRLMDLGTKGSGTTPYSRDGDGRLTLKGGVREILATEMLEALGVNTSKSFSLIETGEELYRSDEPSPARSAVLVRLSHGHIRIGTFQRHAYFQDHAKLIALTRYCLKYYYDDEKDRSDEDAITHFISLVSEKIATLAAETMAAGFVHGVLNTDNINITGESFDYGPWRFLPNFDPSFTAAYFDHSGLYAYGRQPEAIQWNLYQLAGCFLEIVDEEQLRGAVKDYPEQFTTALRRLLLKRLGLKPCGDSADDAMLKALNDFMLSSELGYEQILFDWYGGAVSEKRAMFGPRADGYMSKEFTTFKDLLMGYEAIDASKLNQAYFQRENPCTMLIDEMEAIWTPIAAEDDWSDFDMRIKEIREMGEAYANR